MSYPRTNYEMTQADLDRILDACKPTPVMFLSGGVPMGGSPQENANTAWATLGKQMGFEPMSIRPIQGKGMRFFTAIPSETEEARQEREKAVAEELRRNQITRLQDEILDRQKQLDDIQRGSLKECECQRVVSLAGS
jgi:hypothetical protein